ncbi:pentapeptide repeat-containing protein [Streptomyces sp. NPDC048419]|uniref:pentapeptide repeat-containing protein n=1 Tax=Streptomyces sp. NPDC048419 TaxID=3365547 RepID=UPI0037181CC5
MNRDPESREDPDEGPGDPAPNAADSENPDGPAPAQPTPVRVTEPTQDELNALPAERRWELLQQEKQYEAEERERRRQSRHQWFNSIGILFGVFFAAAGLVATALSWRTGQNELRTAREGQIIDRYTRATEELGASGRDVRTSAVYALERIAHDSARDRATIIDVLAAFVREHDPATSVPDAKLPPEPDTDVQAALTVLGRLPRASHEFTDLHRIRVPGVELPTRTLSGMNLFRADLKGANLAFARASYMNLTEANLSHAELSDARLTGSSLRYADLTGANLEDADLRGADLTGARGITAAAIRKVARTDVTTKF